MIKMIFVGGCPRSGTSLVQKILNNHPRVFGGPEFDHLPQIIKLYKELTKGIENGRQLDYYDHEKLKKNMSNFVYGLLNISGHDQQYISEKTPDNIFVFDTLHKIFPNAKFISTIRDPRAIMYSFEKVYKKSKKINVDIVGFGANVFLDIYRINRSLVIIEDYFNNNQFDCHFIRYEDLVTNPDIVVPALCNYLQIPYEAEMLDLEKNNDVVGLHENKSVQAFVTPLSRSNIDAASISSWTSDLSASKASICNLYFKMKNYRILKPYEFHIQYLPVIFYMLFHILLSIPFVFKVLIFYPKKVMRFLLGNLAK